jgi:3-phosphoshikimate 1-carboxyvinyltransferase
MTFEKKKIRGVVTVPGDKSISHRAVMFAGMADGSSRIGGFLHAEDTLRTAAMMRALGATVDFQSPTDVRVAGRGMHDLTEPADVIDAGNSGTTIRIGSGLLAAQPFLSIVTGDQYLRRRPMGRVIKPLVEMGASIAARDGNRLPPLCIRGGNLSGMTYEMPVASAQVKSALLIAGLYASGPVTVVEPMLSRDHTERMLSAMGARIERDGRAVTAFPASSLSASDFAVPADISSAAFFLVLGACVPGAEIRMPGIGTNPFRTGILDVLRRMGAGIVEENVRDEGGEPVADLVVRGGSLKATSVAPEEIPGLVDEVPALCVAAAFAEGRTEIRGAEELRVKESDRIRSMTDALTALGVRCGEYPDGMWVEGPATIAPGVRCDSRGDHRIAMSLAILSVASGVGVGISDIQCIDTSFPTFHAQLAGLLS